MTTADAATGGTTDDAVEAGARALSEHWWDMHTGGSLDRQRDLAGHAARTMWPILSAGLRELHPAQWECGNPRHTNPEVGCPECSEVCATCDRAMPCPTVRELDRIDEELGL